MQRRDRDVALGDRAMEVDCLSLLAKSCINDGRPWQALDMAQAAYTISREIEPLSACTKANGRLALA